MCNIHISLRMLQASKDNVIRDSFQDPVLCFNVCNCSQSQPSDWLSDRSGRCNFGASGVLCGKVPNTFKMKNSAMATKAIVRP